MAINTTPVKHSYYIVLHTHNKEIQNMKMKVKSVELDRPEHTYKPDKNIICTKTLEWILLYICMQYIAISHITLTK